RARGGRAARGHRAGGEARVLPRHVSQRRAAAAAGADGDPLPPAAARAPFRPAGRGTHTLAVARAGPRGGAATPPDLVVERALAEPGGPRARALRRPARGRRGRPLGRRLRSLGSRGARRIAGIEPRACRRRGPWGGTAARAAAL